jgi:hypothetical protein
MGIPGADAVYVEVWIGLELDEDVEVDVGVVRIALCVRMMLSARVGRLLTLDMVEGAEFWVWRARCAVLVRWPGTAD